MSRLTIQDREQIAQVFNAQARGFAELNSVDIFRMESGLDYCPSHPVWQIINAEIDSLLQSKNPSFDKIEDANL